MRTIKIKAPQWIEGTPREWSARYTVSGTHSAWAISIESRSSIEVIVAKAVSLSGEQYYISSPNFGVAIPGIPSLQETFWVTEKLLHAGMPGPDAATVAQVLRDLSQFEDNESEKYCVLRRSEDLFDRGNDYFDKPRFFKTIDEAKAYAAEAVECIRNYPADCDAYVFRLVED